jgi:hypothetical protein
MAGAVLGLGVPGIEVLNVATVGKTFPDFTTLWEGLLSARGGDPPGEYSNFVPAAKEIPGETQN